nr:MAG TPA: Serine endopeptidase inhibitor [Caudoviricetes sp.]
MKRPKNRGQNRPFFARFFPGFLPKTTISCGLTSLFSFQTTIPHHYYRLDMHRKSMSKNHVCYTIL